MKEHAQAGSKSTLAHVPIEHFWKIITDYEGYPSVVDDVRAARIDSREGNTTVATFTAKVLLKSFDYTIALVEEGPRRLNWSLVHSDSFHSNNGGWMLEAVGPELTQVTYWMEIKSTLKIPKTFVSAAARLALPSVLKRWCAYAENTYAAQRGVGASAASM